MTAEHLPAGVHRIPEGRYHADELRPEPTLSSTLARLILDRSPRHAWAAHPRLNPDWEPEERRTFDVGRAAHRVVLGRGAEYAAVPEELLDTRGGLGTKAAREWCDAKRADGVTPLRPADAEAVTRMAAAVEGRLSVMGLGLDPERSELTALAEVDGVWCRALIDNAPADPAAPLYDFKTCEDASPDALVRAVLRYGYDVQAAHYLDTWEAATGERRGFRFVFVEKRPPHEVAVVELCDDPDDPGDWMETARSKAREARRIWGRCLETGEWPGYPAQVGILTAPVWYAAAWAERETGEIAAARERPTSAAIRAAMEFQAP